MLKELLARGLLDRRDIGKGMDRWTLTGLGNAVVAEEIPPGRRSS